MVSKNIQQLHHHSITVLSPETIAEKDYEHALSEKRDRIVAIRGAIWATLVALVGGSVYASLQASTVSDAIALYPLLACCLARVAAHNEHVIDQLKAYILYLERKSGYAGYETWNKANKRKSSGSHLVALRDTLVLTQALASAVAAWNLITVNHFIPVACIVAAIDLAAIVLTFRLLHERKTT